MLNTVILMGRLVADPELKKAGENNVVNVRVAVDRNSKDGGADFIDVTAWRQTAEFLAKYFKKGSMVAIEGSLRTDTYTDKDGNKRRRVDVLANRVSFCGSKSESGTGSAEPAKDAKEVFEVPEDLGGDDEDDFEL